VKNSLRYALLGGAALAAMGGIAVMALTGPAAPRAPLPELRESTDDTQAGNQTRGGGGRFFRDYDLDHDGRVTREEFDQSLNQQFAEASHGSDTVTAAQFEAAAAKDYRSRADQNFHRVDWNNDGKVSLEEFFVPVRAEFQRLDRDAKGAVSCTRQNSQSPQNPPSGTSNRGRGARGAQSLAGFCRDYDLNKDGTVTHAEFDQAVQQKFAAAAGATKDLTSDAFYGLELARFKDANARLFQRLDANSDGKLTKDEFMARGAKTFARLDKNADGVVTKKEAAANRRNKPARG
jgi:Ca2+-binding EF-hand superfamily protein